MTLEAKDISESVKRAKVWDEQSALVVARGLVEHYSGRLNWDDENWISVLDSRNRVLAVINIIRAFSFVRVDVSDSLQDSYPKIEWLPFNEYSTPEFSMEPSLLATHFYGDEAYWDHEDYNPAAFSAHTLWYMTVH